MTIQIQYTSQMTAPSLVLCLYGQGGVGKSTLSATAPDPIILDSEEGVKAFRARDIDIPFIAIKSWNDVQEAWGLISKSEDYKTVVIDPVDVFVTLLIEDVSGAGSMTLQKWGLVKNRMRKFIWAVKSSGKHVVFVAHEGEVQDEDKLIRSPKLAANLSGELIDLCDVVGHLRIGEGDVRELLVQPMEKYKAKDRYDAFGKILKNPNVTEMISTIHKKYEEPPFEDKNIPNLKNL